MDKNYDGTTFFHNTFILRRSRVANFVDIIQIVTMFIKTTFKDQKELEELESIYKILIYICIS